MARVQNFAVRWITGGFRGTLIGAMELLPGIPPLRLRCNLHLAGYTARIMALLDNHLLRQAWQAEQRLRHFTPKQRPRYLPIDNPLTRLKTMGTCGEKFLEVYEANRPGTRVTDIYAERMSYINLNAPKKGTGGFQEWIQGFWRERKRGTQASIITRAGREVASDMEWVLATSSFDAEIAALEAALA